MFKLMQDLDLQYFTCQKKVFGIAPFQSLTFFSAPDYTTQVESKYYIFVNA